MALPIGYRPCIGKHEVSRTTEKEEKDMAAKSKKEETKANTPEAKAPRKGLSDSSVLRVVSAETKSKCSLDVIAAIN